MGGRLSGPRAMGVRLRAVAMGVRLRAVAVCVITMLTLVVMVVGSGVAWAHPSVTPARLHRHRWPAGHGAGGRSFQRLLRRRAALGHAPAPRASVPRARAAIVGGSTIAIGQAPWQVEIVASFKEFGNEEEGLSCGGSIIDSTHILTAGHCVFDEKNEMRLGAGSFVVLAGTASVTEEEIKHNPELQARFVSTVRVHPLFDYPAGAGTPDDVAVLTLEKPLTLGGTAQAIGLAGAGAAPPEGAGVNVTGFGQQNPEANPDGLLYSIGLTVAPIGRCDGEADAVFICASSPSGTACNGDSGSGLTAGVPAALVGVTDVVEVLAGQRCVPGATDGFVNVAAPEIRDFIEGSENPPQAPRGGEGIVVRAVPKVGYTVTCEPGPWTGSPTFTYAFINSANGQTLQVGASTTFPLTAADVGATIYCQVLASNAGGTGVVRTTALRPVEASPSGTQPQPKPPLPAVQSVAALASKSLAARGDGAVTLRFECVGAVPCNDRLSLVARQTLRRRGHRISRTVTIGTTVALIVAGKTESLTIHLNRTGRALLHAGHGQLAATLLIEQASGRVQAVTVQLVESASRGRARRR
jgi:hypothetical protein